MLRHLLKNRSINLEHGKTTLALEPEYWNILETFAVRDGFQDWRTYFYAMLQEHRRKCLCVELIELTGMTYHD